MLRVNVPLDPTRTGREAEALETSLCRMIVGQDEAIQQIVNIYQMHLTGMTPPGRPIGNFLFLGPTGSGKTRIVEATAEALVKNARAVIKIDCAEFQHSHEIAKLIGSPPGYLGHRETHPLLSQEVLNQYHTETMQAQLRAFRRDRKSQRRALELVARHPGQGDADARRQSQGRFFARPDLHDQQFGRIRNEFSDESAARIQRRSTRISPRPGLWTKR